jgi:hypothetical protein
VTAVSRTVFDLHIPDTVKTDIGLTSIGLLLVDFSVKVAEGSPLPYLGNV